MKNLNIAILIVAVLLSGLMMFPAMSNAEVNLNITIPLPGPALAQPPALVAIPGTYAYFAPDVEADLFFYQGYWYRPYRGEWYYSIEYNGPWGRVAVGNLPPPLVQLPPDYRTVPPGYGRMPYETVKRNWQQWERERYWDHDSEERPMPHHGHGMGGGMGMGRHGN